MTDPGLAPVDDPQLVSVVIVAYNAWPELEVAIESALCQSYRPLEVIVVDNDSSDATAEEIPRRFGDRVRYIRQPNLKNSGGYNSGFRAAAGNFIQFLDGDDVLAPNKIAKQMEVFRAHPEADIVYGDIRQFQALPGIPRWEDYPTRQYDDMVAAMITTNGYGASLSVLGALLRRQTLERVGPWDESIHITDWDYWLRAAWAGCRFVHCPGGPMGFYRRSPGQMTEDAAAMRSGMEEIWEKALGYINREPYRQNVARCLASVRFHQAIKQERLTTSEALAKLRLARAADPGLFSPLAYPLAWALIVLPGGRSLARSRRLGKMRQGLARLLALDAEG
jgi:glycosyltransferase involved in cell wall biosynthesis